MAAACLTRRVCLLSDKMTVVRANGLTLMQINAFSVTKWAHASEDTKVHIPAERLTVTYSRSSGPGGQHVNKGEYSVKECPEGSAGFWVQDFHPTLTVNTKAKVRFHVHTADWIPEDIRLKVIEKNRSRMNKAGELLVSSEVSRSQHRNLSDCLQKISTILAEASEKPHEPTAEDVALRAARLKKRKEERLKQKKIHSGTKQSRRVDFD
ncbi:peptidyl-tRNA hydrolase ICT1, mitochondrial isoform X2 [Oryzias latipes]|uniref:peptidyl-tRNA hydrolase ICT1, mitochondrial isoform X2 n=1 Tax=Oryzias latipes TaxID=8090 RepID=UPI000CE20BD6|nr:peptidyl-tRNA hydrolase ICT1, mitochondrial isoform X2 [Oryzias latipes]